MADAEQADLYRRALAALRETRARLAEYEELERLRNEPIAVIGIGCRFPGGVEDWQGYWDLLLRGGDAISEVPAERWDAAALYDPDPDAAGKTYSRHGGFIAGIDRFDAEFFGIAPREAASVDPQQRLLLEVAWEALEQAGLPPPSLAGSRTGVYVGVTATDYGRLLLASATAGEPLDPYFVTGATLNAVAGRVAFCLGLAGPAVAVDTACSSSLVAVHLACQALRQGECELALAGGVNVILSPEHTVAISRARMLSTGGRCRVFDAGADGYVRGEGAGVVVLKPLSRAVAAGDEVWAVLRGSAVNQDGRTSGLTVPSGPAQAALIAEALRRAGVDAGSVGYVEAHGTGTALGDPIEAEALGRAFGGRAGERPLLIGSVKANIGHLEAAAGIAGLVKAVLAVRHGVVPPQLHFSAPNPHIAWSRLPLRVPVQAEAWPGERRVAGVSSFGFSGTNAHVVVEAAPATEGEASEAVPVGGCGLLVVSGRGAAALRAQAARWREWLLAHPQAGLAAVCRGAAQGRAALPSRLAVVAADTAGLAAGLTRYVESGEGIAGDAGRVKLGFVFSGQGAQWSGMGRELYDGSAAFRAVVERCAAAVAEELERPLLEVMFAGGAALDRTDYAQPALYALQCGLVELWRGWGIEPAAVLGHSVGEYAAAYAAGVMDLEAGARLVARRGRLMQGLAGDGVMAAVTAPPEQVLAALSGWEEQAALAAVNGPQACVVSGERAAVAAVCAALGVAGRPLAVSHAFHSPQMAPMLAEFAGSFAGVALAAPRLAVVSTVSGTEAGAALREAEYWVRQVRAPVRFAAGLQRLTGLGCEVLVEVGPRPGLLGLARQNGYEGGLLASLRPGVGAWHSLLASLGELWVRGAAVDWAAVWGRGSKAALPSYAFQRKRHWLATPRADAAANPPAVAVEWVAATSGGAAAMAAGRWLVVPEAGGAVASAVAAELARRGGSVQLADAAETGSALAAEGRRVVDLRPLAAGGPAGQVAVCAAAVRLLQGLRASGGRLWAVVDDAEPSALPGLLRAAWLEQPGAMGGVVRRRGAVSAAALVDALLAGDGESEVLLAGEARRVPRLVRHPLPAGRARLAAEGVYLVTGGYGGLGVQVARWLAQRGARTIALAGRRPAGAAAVIAELRAAEVEVICEQADLGDEASTAALLQRLRADGRALRGVVHAAGLTSQRPLAELDEAELARVLAPKLGLATLDRLTRERPPELFVAFSSIAAVWGSKGQAAYAAANGYMDEVVAARRAAGLPGVSVNWGPWRGAGMLDEAAAAWLGAAGVRPLDPAAALGALDRLVASGAERRVVADVDWPRLAGLQASLGLGRLFDALLDTSPAAPLLAHPDHAPLRSTLSKTPELARLQLLVETIEAEVARALRLEQNPFADGQDGFFEAGVDSFTAIELCNRFHQLLGCELPNTLLLEYPTPEALAGHLLATVFGMAEPPVAPNTPNAEESALLIETEFRALLGEVSK